MTDLAGVFVDGHGGVGGEMVKLPLRRQQRVTGTSSALFYSFSEQ